MSKRLNDEESRSFKRVNSKEEIVEDIVDDFGRPMKALPFLQQISRDRISSCGKIKEITSSLMNDQKRKNALAALEATYSAESLKCLIDLLDWENMEPGENRSKLANDIVEKYIKTDEVCIPDKLRRKLLREYQKDLTEEDLQEVKRVVTNDLRFNKTLLVALNHAWN